MRYLARRCPECGNQFPISFKKCIYCKTDLRRVVPSEREPLDMAPIETPMKAKLKKRRSIPRIKKFKGYEELVMDLSREDPVGDVC